MALIYLYNIRNKWENADFIQMLESTGWCPGFRNTTTLEEYESIYGKVRRKPRKMAWTDESKQEAIDMYTAEELLRKQYGDCQRHCCHN